MVFFSKIDFYRQRNLHHSIDATQAVSEIAKQSIEVIDQMRKSGAHKPSTVLAQQESLRQMEKQSQEEVSNVKSKTLNNQYDTDTNRLSSNFLLIYNSVTSVLRERGII